MRKNYPVYDPVKKRDYEKLEEYIVRIFKETREAQEYRSRLRHCKTFPLARNEEN